MEDGRLMEELQGGKEELGYFEDSFLTTQVLLPLM